jgi:hypothetical protein
MHSHIIKTLFNNICRSSTFQPSKGHSQEVQLTHSKNKDNQMSQQIKIQPMVLRYTP